MLRIIIISTFFSFGVLFISCSNHNKVSTLNTSFSEVLQFINDKGNLKGLLNYEILISPEPIYQENNETIEMLTFIFDHEPLKFKPGASKIDTNAFSSLLSKYNVSCNYLDEKIIGDEELINYLKEMEKNRMLIHHTPLVTFGTKTYVVFIFGRNVYFGVEIEGDKAVIVSTSNF